MCCILRVKALLVNLDIKRNFQSKNWVIYNSKRQDWFRPEANPKKVFTPYDKFTNMS